MARVAKLGCAMARSERGLAPMPIGLPTRIPYAEFVIIHRQALELQPVFETWDVRLQRLIDRDARSSGLRADDVRQWDLFYRYVSLPLRAAFWEAWEKEVGLPQFFEKHACPAHESRRRLIRPNSPMDAASTPMGQQTQNGSVRHLAICRHSPPNPFTRPISASTIGVHASFRTDE